MRDGVLLLKVGGEIGRLHLDVDSPLEAELARANETSSVLIAVLAIVVHLLAVYRYELSGAIHGLLRSRGFPQDDAHIFCTREHGSIFQIEYL